MFNNNIVFQASFWECHENRTDNVTHATKPFLSKPIKPQNGADEQKWCEVSDVLLTLAEVDMAPAIFIWEFITLVWVDIEVTFELTAYVRFFCFLSWTNSLARILQASRLPVLAIFFISISCSQKGTTNGFITFRVNKGVHISWCRVLFVLILF